MNLKKLKIAVVGATGAVGRALLNILYEKGIPKENVTAIASNRNRNQAISYGNEGTGEELIIKSLDDFNFSTTQIAFFAIDSQYAAKYIPIAVSQGALVIDKSVHYRLQEDIPLIVPEVNPETLAIAEKTHIIANPNCSVIPLVATLKPIHNINPIKRIITATYQSVSGAGSIAMDLLYQETKTILMNQPANDITIFPKPISFNVIPQIDDFAPNGFTKEELKMHLETQKILSHEIEVIATCVRVPVFIGHSLAVTVDLTSKVDLKTITEALRKSKALHVATCHSEYETPIEAAHEDAIFVSRLRVDSQTPHSLTFWVVTDNIRKGAALNGIQIAETVAKNYSHLIRN